MKRILFAAIVATTSTIAGAQNREALIGCWTMQSEHGTEALSLNRSGYFSFNDWNRRRGDFETLNGKWSFDRSNKITLLYQDRSKQSFSVTKDRRGRWLLTKAGGFMLYKGDPSECSNK